MYGVGENGSTGERLGAGLLLTPIAVVINEELAGRVGSTSRLRVAVSSAEVPGPEIIDVKEVVTESAAGSTLTCLLLPVAVRARVADTGLADLHGVASSGETTFDEGAQAQVLHVIASAVNREHASMLLPGQQPGPQPNQNNPICRMFPRLCGGRPARAVQD